MKKNETITIHSQNSISSRLALRLRKCLRHTNRWLLLKRWQWRPWSFHCCHNPFVIPIYVNVLFISSHHRSLSLCLCKRIRWKLISTTSAYIRRGSVIEKWIDTDLPAERRERQRWRDGIGLTFDAFDYDYCVRTKSRLMWIYKIIIIDSRSLSVLTKAGDNRCMSESDQSSNGNSFSRILIYSERRTRFKRILLCNDAYECLSTAN